MKRIQNLKLTQLSKVELEKREMNGLKGGGPDDNSCNCNCSGATTKEATRSANSVYGYQYSYGGDGSHLDLCGCNCGGNSLAASSRVIMGRH